MRTVSTSKSLVSERIESWLFLEPSYLPLIRRLVPLVYLPSLLMIWVLSRGGQGPFTVPCWNWQGQAFTPIMPPDWVSVIAFAVAVCAALAQAFGSRSSWTLVPMVLVQAYYGSCDLLAFHCSFITLIFWFLIALLFDNGDQKSCARRLIQLGVFVCYFFSILQKCTFPDFMSGVSFQALFSDGWPMRHVFVPITDRLSTMPLVFWKVSAWLTILLEAFLAVGLFLPKVRRTALTIGILFHFAILVLIDDANVIAIYSLTIFIGYLAFLPPRANQEEPSNHLELARTKILLQTCLAAAFIGAIFVIPSRLYFWKDRPPSDLNFYDRSPWAFAMFLMRQTTTSVQIDCKSKDKDWFSYPLEGRMKTISSDSELVALATYLYKSVPRLEKLHIVVTCLINKHWQQIKTFDTKRDQKIFEYKLAIQNKKSRADTI